MTHAMHATRSSVVARFSSELAVRRRLVRAAARHHELADGPDDLPLELAPLQRRPLVLGAVAAAASEVLVVELHGSSHSSPCFLSSVSTGSLPLCVMRVV
jgi:hypothetical protein